MGEIMTYKHIVFDIDGTLIDTEYAILHSLQKTLEVTLNKKIEISKLTFALGIPGENALGKLGIDNISATLELWNENMNEFSDKINIFSGIDDVLKALTSSGYKLGIVTSKTKDEFIQDFYKLEINNYFDIVVCADDTEKHKPFPDPLIKYMELSRVEKHEILYIGDTEYDMNCARLSKIDFALAGWGVHTNKHIQATYYLKEPTDIFTILFSKRNKKNLSDWLKWAMELQFIGQVGLTYSKDNFDIERFQRIREISAEILSNYTDYGVEKINDIFCNETGFQTPKIDTRAAIFNNDKILLVKELDGKWSLPGGWVDVNQSIYSNIIKEVKEEAGLNVIPKKIIAAQDRNKHNYPVYAYGICKVFILCENNGGKFETNIETIESEYFSMDNLPDLALEKNTVEQIKMCFASNNSDKWEALFD
mgnify:FL=1